MHLKSKMKSSINIPGERMMKQRAWHVAAVALAALAVVLVLPHFSGRAEAVKEATGPFAYDPPIAGSTTFLGEAGGPVTGGFRICAPGGGDTFPTGKSSATADIRVFGIEQVGEADGNPLADPIKVPLDSSLGISIDTAFSLDPDSYTFQPGNCVDVDVMVNNPMVDDTDYGDYVVTIKAQAVDDQQPRGSGIGVGSGSRYHLSLRGATVTDTIPPIVTINSPSGDNILGVISVEITANDPVPGTGVETMSATVSSAGGAVSDEAIALTDNAPQPAGSPATATGTFIPTGGTGSEGTTLASAFTSTSRSGIGTYTLTAEATDGAGNIGKKTSTFQVKYDVAFTQADQIGGNNANSTGRFAFTVKRSALTSDGASMYDRTVVVKLVRTSDNTVVATHVYGTGDIKAYVQIDATDPANPVYQTRFKRGDIGASASNTYKARVFFLDVDGTLVQQVESAPVSF
jgi:hypothetical protein